MFNHTLHRSRKRRQIKSILKFLFFIALFWWLIIYGFMQNEDENSQEFGEILDRNQIEKSMMKFRRRPTKDNEESNESNDERLKSAKNEIELNSNDIIQETKLSENDKNILETFLNKNKETKKPNESMTAENVAVMEEDSATNKSNDSKYGLLGYLMNNINIFPISELLGDYGKELNTADMTNIFEGFDTKSLIETVNRAQNFMNESLVETENKTQPKTNDDNSRNNEEVIINNNGGELNEIINSPSDKIIDETENAEEAPKPDEADDEKQTTPFGDYGHPVTLPQDIPDNIKKLVQDGWSKHEFNEYVSNLIPINRTLQDFRSNYCRDMQKVYSKLLPTVSIIIVFHNEAWSTLIRSIESIINRTPKNLYKEIILVDDFSEFEHLKGQLDDYVGKNKILKLIRLQERKGLINARNTGADAAKSDVLVFLDSHIECTQGWLEPLLDRILLNDTTIAVPVIEIIDDHTFALEPKLRNQYVSLGGFRWNLNFRWFHKPLSELKEPQGAVKSPTMAGGLYAISSKFFKHLGMYDPGLDVWGGENLEISFKAWMCGGSIEIVQCSHVGHVFRKKSPYKWRGKADVMRKNSLRVAKVWMDEYAVFYNYAAGFIDTDYGDISERVKLRKSLNCRSFDWYLKNVYPEIKIPSHGIAYGQIQNLGFGGKRCLNGKLGANSPSLNLTPCHGYGGDQFWVYDGEISRDNHCVTYDAHNLMTQHCKKNSSKQLFTYDPDEKQLYINQKEKKCLTMTKDFELTIEKCIKNLEGQKWKLENLKLKRVKKF